MLKLKLIRFNPENKEQNFTRGELFTWSESLNKWMDFCYTLEDKVRDFNKDGDLEDEGEEKVYGETAIPFSLKNKPYNGQITWSPAFNRMMPEILNVPGFTGIRLHGGNDIGDTYGCPLIAFNTDNKGKIWGSALNDLIKLINANDKEGKFTIEIT